MALFKTLENLVEQLKAETGNSVTVNVGVDYVANLKQTLRRVQETLYDDYDWPHLRIMPTKDLVDDQHLYDMPTDLNYDRIEEVRAWYSGHPYAICRGVSFEDYDQYSSVDGEKVDPVRKWDIRWTGADLQIEVWPMPASNVQHLQFRGIRKLRDLVSDSDVADLDDRLIVLFAAAELLARQKSADAQIKLAQAQQRYSRLKSRVTGGADTITLGGTSGERDRPRGTIIRVS